MKPLAHRNIGDIGIHIGILICIHHNRHSICVAANEDSRGEQWPRKSVALVKYVL